MIFLNYFVVEYFKQDKSVLEIIMEIDFGDIL